MFAEGDTLMLDLYILETCPYCRKVMDFFEENDIAYNKKNISDKENREELLKLGGYEQVPYLFDTEKNNGMYESEDIIKYVKDRG